MTDAYIFSGPTLPPNDEFVLKSRKKIKFLPPVSEGDILAILPQQPKIIGIIDGYFETVPAVWHKEILLAMSQGVHVLGAASMGALRAAELEAFGMEGVGAIFRAFSDGLLEDDDEVAVIHGSAEQGYPLLSEAMVNIRRTVEDAGKEGILTPSECAALIRIAKGLHYKSRNYGKIFGAAEQEGLKLDNFRHWLPEGRKDQKAIDAMDLLQKIIERLEGEIEPKRVLYHLEDTIIWKKNRSKT